MLNDSFNPVMLEAFHGAVLDAWLTLRDDARELKRIIDRMLQDDRYMRVPERSPGITGMVIEREKVREAELEQN